MAEGDIVYVLTNEAMPGHVKVGRTSDLIRHIRELDTTSVPLPFDCYYAARVRDANLVEKLIFEAFGDRRVRSNREFFRAAPERVAAAIRIGELEDLTPKLDVVDTAEDQRALDEARKRRTNFKFDLVGISPGTVLKFIRDETVTATVVDNRKVNFNGDVTCLSAAAQKAFAKLGYNWPAVSGPASWVYDNETLDERRVRMAEEVE